MVWHIAGYITLGVSLLLLALYITLYILFSHNKDANAGTKSLTKDPVIKRVQVSKSEESVMYKPSDSIDVMQYILTRKPGENSLLLQYKEKGKGIYLRLYLYGKRGTFRRIMVLKDDDKSRERLLIKMPGFVHSIKITEMTSEKENNENKVHQKLKKLDFLLYPTILISAYTLVYYLMAYVHKSLINYYLNYFPGFLWLIILTIALTIAISFIVVSSRPKFKELYVEE